MLRSIQTTALSNKIATLFDALVPATQVKAQPILIEAAQPHDHRAKLCDQPPRRRYARRHRFDVQPSAVKTSWF